MPRSTKAPSSAVTAAQSLRVFVGRLRRHLQDASAVGELTASQASVLARLTQTEPSSASVLAGAERVRPQSMAAIIGALEERGLVHRTPDPDDGRRQLISLTREGRAHAQGARATREEWLINAMQTKFTEAERVTINEAIVLLERVVEP